MDYCTIGAEKFQLRVRKDETAFRNTVGKNTIGASKFQLRVRKDVPTVPNAMGKY